MVEDAKADDTLPTFLRIEPTPGADIRETRAMGFKSPYVVRPRVSQQSINQSVPVS